jgi:hypothetical protein
VAAVARSLGVDESALRRRYPCQIDELSSRVAARREVERHNCRDDAFLVYSAAAEDFAAESHVICRKSLECESVAWRRPAGPGPHVCALRRSAEIRLERIDFGRSDFEATVPRRKSNVLNGRG